MSTPLLIYPDTNIWSYLAQRPVDEAKLIAALTSKNATLLLSPHAVYELARAFTGNSAPAVGIHLFSSLKRFLDLGIPCSEEFKTLTKEECYALENHLSEIDPLLGPTDRDIVGVEVGKLANGIIEQPVGDFIEKRTEAAVDTRVDQREHVAARKELREKLKAISQPDLAAWLKTETMSPYGIEVFYQHLKKMHGNGPTREYARDVLLSAPAHAARALVRADLYSNWRAGTRGSNPADLVDDMLHILQAIYSDFYVTGENKQTEYASLLLTPRTKVAIYDLKTPIDEWLLSLV
jgi:hypothetical protein